MCLHFTSFTETVVMIQLCKEGQWHILVMGLHEHGGNKDQLICCFSFFFFYRFSTLAAGNWTYGDV